MKNAPTLYGVYIIADVLVAENPPKYCLVPILDRLKLLVTAQTYKLTSIGDPGLYCTTNDMNKARSSLVTATLAILKELQFQDHVCANSN